MLGGEMVARSVPGEGSVFSFSIDAGPLNDVEMVYDLPSAAERVVESESAQPAQPLNARVLLAEDTPDSQELLAFHLRTAGAEVEVTDNGVVTCERALAAAAAGVPFDVILMDMQMPELDGEQATVRLRRLGYTGSIVALTAHAMRSERERCLSAGCDDFASKPIDAASLIAIVRRHAGVRRSGAGGESSVPVVSTFEGNAELMALRDRFVAGLPMRVCAMERGLEAGDLAVVAKLAHQLKGTGGGYGFAPISEAAASLEASIGARLALDTIRRQMREVADLCRRARTAAPSADEGSGHAARL
jgi:CheY-like chemotaxis protein